ncbi:hypothetical protein ASPVEDRAFT_156216 [Aspergillus versicolor CBS 583.65]|uniref:FAD-binding PCMH-type domain-containing protein n=1 Tax=Aspergillus versicolor CBS 583.65 TaxID=1036611 RepID=A0A1L9Q498_ASPVE|nr:uncharacterized protein ASPVEDRAFT_156216 [Aspergillus versicolor CBS 583.65]OJJ08590.1 hypothetical protein ASPVEDRAFT_156216 [Aspergillus versicolor CBS 583.65]
MATAAISQLRAILPEDRIITPDTSSYETAVTTPWSQTCWTPAACYIYPSNTHELASALSIIKKTGCKFAIQTTGHNPNVGFSSADQTGVVLNLRRFKSIEIVHGSGSGSYLDGAVARVGPGCTWGEVYAWLEESKLSVIGGRDQQVGLGGFLTGGGMGALPNLYGLGADGVKNFEILLGDGRLVNANSSGNTDLYRALKGGGSNFGIVTRFDLETHPLIHLQYTINLYNPDGYIEINKATVAVQEAMETDPKLGLFTNFNQGFVAVGLLYGDTSIEHPAAFKPFDDLSVISTVLPTTNGTLLSLAQAMGHAQEPKKRAICTVTTRVSQDLYEEVYHVWKKTCATLPAECVLHYTIQPMGAAGVKAGTDRGGNIMGLECVHQCWWVCTCEWPSSSEADADTAAQKAVDGMAENIQSLAREKDLLLDFLCMSFATGSQGVLRSYGAGNVKRMQDVAEKYDPDGVFQKLQNGGFLLREI